MMKPFTLSLLLIATAASGCLGGADDTSDPASDDDSDAAPPGGTTTNGSSPSTPSASTPNAPPTAALTPSATNGTAPLNVSFAIEAADPDGDNLSWTFDADGDGQAEETGAVVPASVNATYAQAGVFVAMIDVTDGNASVRSTVEINVTAASGGAAVLYFVGDGSTTVVADPTTAQAGTNPCVTDFGLSPDGNGDADTTFVVFPSGNPSLGKNCLLPSFIFEGDVALTGGPVAIHAYVNFACPPNLASDAFPMHALLMDAAGNALGPLSSAYPDPGSSVSEIVFAFTPEAGTYDGLQVQYGKSASSSPESPCLPFVTQWGSEAHNGRIEFAPGDAVTVAAA